jgi:hypothetical protein
MINEVIRGSFVAFIVWALSLVCLYIRLLPTYYFAAVLAVWMMYALYRVALLFTKRVTPMEIHSRRDALAYWLGAVGSSLLAPPLWMLVVSRISVF